MNGFNEEDYNNELTGGTLVTVQVIESSNFSLRLQLRKLKLEL